MKIFIYGLFNPVVPDSILYVGQTGDLVSRMYSHQRGKDKRTGKWTAELAKQGVIPGFKILETTDILNATSREAFWIDHYGPLLNSKIAKRFEFRVSPITTLQDLELKYIRWALDYFAGNKQATCRALGIGRQTLYNKLRAAGHCEPSQSEPETP